MKARERESETYFRFALTCSTVEWIHNLPCCECCPINEHKNSDNHKKFVVFDELRNKNKKENFLCVRNIRKKNINKSKRITQKSVPGKLCLTFLLSLMSVKIACTRHVLLNILKKKKQKKSNILDLQ